MQLSATSKMEVPTIMIDNFPD